MLISWLAHRQPEGKIRKKEMFKSGLSSHPGRKLLPSDAPDALLNWHHLNILQVNISANDWLVVMSCTWWMPAAPPPPGPGRQAARQHELMCPWDTPPPTKRKKKKAQDGAMFHPEVGPWQIKWVWDTFFLVRALEWKHSSARLLLHL